MGPRDVFNLAIFPDAIHAGDEGLCYHCDEATAWAKAIEPVLSGSRHASAGNESRVSQFDITAQFVGVFSLDVTDMVHLDPLFAPIISCPSKTVD